MQGRLDSPLTDLGKEQVIGHGRKLRELGGANRMVVSPSGRTQETAHLLNSFLSAQIQINDVLMERDCGEWSGLTIDEIEAKYPQQWRERGLDPFNHRPPEGENLPDMLGRIEEFLEGLYSTAEESLVLVTHGVMSRAILTHFLALTPGEADRVRHPHELFYALQFTATDIRPSYFLEGDGPHDGLLRTAAEGTVVRPDALKPQSE